MTTIPKAGTVEQALTHFPGVTASARYFNRSWQFRLESDALFVYVETRRRDTWQAAFRDACALYRRQGIAEWELAQIRRTR